MRNKLKKRLNKYFNKKNFWDNLSKEIKQKYVEIGAYKVWCQIKKKEVLDFTKEIQ